MKTQHLILTRINIGVFSYEPRTFDGVHGDNRISESHSWMTYRLNLIRKFLIKNLMDQELDKFTWVVLFDIKTPKKYITEFENICAGIEDIEYIYLSTRYTDFLDTTEYHEQINEVIDKDADVLITTQLDSDQCISNSYVKKCISTVHDEPLEYPYSISSMCRDKIYLDEGDEIINITSELVLLQESVISLVENINHNDLNTLSTVLRFRHHMWSDIIGGILLENESQLFIRHLCNASLDVSETKKKRIQQQKMDLLIKYGLCEPRNQKERTIVSMPESVNLVVVHIPIMSDSSGHDSQTPIENYILPSIRRQSIQPDIVCVSSDDNNILSRLPPYVYGIYTPTTLSQYELRNELSPEYKKHNICVVNADVNVVMSDDHILSILQKFNTSNVISIMIKKTDTVLIADNRVVKITTSMFSDDTSAVLVGNFTNRSGVSYVGHCCNLEFIDARQVIKYKRQGYFFLKPYNKKVFSTFNLNFELPKEYLKIPQELVGKVPRKLILLQ